MAVSLSEAAPAAAPRVRAVRAFIGRRRRRSWLDWYFAGFAGVIALIYLADVLTGPLNRLSAATGHPDAGSHAAAAQAVAGTGLVIGAAAGLLLLAQALGPLALSPADASWLLAAPLQRRAVLRRPAITAAALSAGTGGLLGVLALAMAGPYLRPASATLPASWLLLSAATGALGCVAAVAGQTLAQPRPRARGAMRAGLAAVAVTAMAGAVAAERWGALSDAVTSGFSGLTTSAFDIAAGAALVLAAVTGTLAWRRLSDFPASVLRTDSARAGRTLMAASFLNLQLLSWIAEDSHWRGRLIASRRWPRLPPPMALAWADWRRLARRPGLLAVTAASALAPALVSAAATGRYRAHVVAGALLLGAIGAGAQGTAAVKRDLNDKALRRLLGAGDTGTLAARAVLPALLSAAWLIIAFAMLAVTGMLSGLLWTAAAAAAGPGTAAAALRMAGTVPINPAEQGPDLPLTAPPWMFTRAMSLLLGLAGTFPVLRAVLAGHVHGSTLVAQLAVSAAVLGIYLMTVSGGAAPGRGRRLSWDVMTTTSDSTPNASQAEAWNGDQGRHWAVNAERQDRMFAGFARLVLDAARIGAGDAVLDLGCGAGGTTMEAARRAADGSVTGADLSGLLLAEAARRAERAGLANVRFEQADAQVHLFPAAGFDVAVSRFGVMFFDDADAAWANIGRALRPGGRLAFCCWREEAVNDFFAVPRAAVGSLVPPPPPADPAAPGPLSLASSERIQGLLAVAGFTSINVIPVTVPLLVGTGPQDAAEYITGMGPARALLSDVPPETRSAGLRALSEAFASRAAGDGVRLDAAIWLVTARRPDA